MSWIFVGMNLVFFFVVLNVILMNVFICIMFVICFLLRLLKSVFGSKVIGICFVVVFWC